MYNALTLDECIEEISKKEEASRKRPLENMQDDAEEEETVEEETGTDNP